MDVMNQIIEQSSLQGMPKWFKTLAIAAFITITTLLLITLIFLLKDGGNTTINFGYLYNKTI
tara:strand:+ start:3350 stop:3535 length:186 start_codon:yes stop_codon:yes gene_type:complete